MNHLKKKERRRNENKKNEVSPFFFSTEKWQPKGKEASSDTCQGQANIRKILAGQIKHSQYRQKNIKPISQHLEVHVYNSPFGIISSPARNRFVDLVPTC